jgi:bifunctional UDP-N-acetylglucosamine pyrophosphorylase/glucosamine-1-phosphate N-acetyltransferase
MKSSLPKVMHKLSGKPLVKWVIDTVSDLKPDNIILVLGYGAEIVRKYLGESSVKNLKIVYQEKRLGTGHATMQAEKVLKNYKGNILVINGDVPLIKSSTLMSLINKNRKTGNSVTVLSAEVENPFGYGRVVKNGWLLEKIVEEKDATLAEKRIKEINSGIYCFDKNLWKVLLKLKTDNAKKEYYITDAVALLKKSGKKVSCMAVRDSYEVKNINTRADLCEAETALKNKKIKELLDNGVSIVDSNSVYISYDAKIGADTVIYPGVFIDNGVSIGKNCIIKGASYIKSSKIGNASVISYSYIHSAVVDKKVKIGPFSRIRESSVLKEGVEVGNFSEIKRSVISKNSKIKHLSYIGDAHVGENVNIGAGTITCNYDGIKKHQTVIGSESFVGSNVNFVAPVKIGRGVLVAAGSTVTGDVPSGKLVIARARQELKNRKTN